MTQDIKAHVLSIINDIENGIKTEYCTECSNELHGEFTCKDCGHENNDTVIGFDYISDVLDVNWLIDSNREFIGARLLVAFGGPNIWINTHSQTVEGHWWSDSFTARYNTDEMDIEGACEEWFNCCA